MSDKITKAELEQQYHMLQEEYGRLSNEHRELKAKYDGCTHELEGVRGALKREAEMRTKAEEELKDWKSRYNVLVRGLEYKSKVQYSSEDKIKELEKDLESMTNSRNWNADEAARLRRWYDNLKKLYDKARKEGEEGCAMWRESCWEIRDELDRYKKKVKELEDLNSKLRENATAWEGKCGLAESRLDDKIKECGQWMDVTFEAREKRDHYKKKAEDLEHLADDLEKQRKELEKKCTELQDRVNILQQRWTDKFNPDDELFGRKIGEWQEYNVVLIKNGIPSPESLDKKLDPFYPERLTATRSYNVMVKHGINDEKELDTELESWQRIKEVLHKHYISPCQLDKCLDQRQCMRHTLREMKKDIEQFNP